MQFSNLFYMLLKINVNAYAFLKDNIINNPLSFTLGIYIYKPEIGLLWKKPQSSDYDILSILF